MCPVERALITAASASCHHRGGATDNATTGTTRIRHTTIATSTTHFPGVTSTYGSISTAGQLQYATHRWSRLNDKIKLKECKESCAVPSVTHKPRGY